MMSYRRATELKTSPTRRVFSSGLTSSSPKLTLSGIGLEALAGLSRLRHIAAMPELPEVETTVRGLEKVLKGRRIASVEARRPDLRRALPVDLGQRLTGAGVSDLGRRAKYGVVECDR